MSDVKRRRGAKVQPRQGPGKRMLTIRVSNEEHAQVAEAAELRRQSMQEFMRDCVMSSAILIVAEEGE